MSAQSPQLVRTAPDDGDDRCRNCPPDCICAWSCIQGAGIEEIVIGAALDEGQLWAQAQASAPGSEVVSRALWETYNG